MSRSIIQEIQAHPVHVSRYRWLALQRVHAGLNLNHLALLELIDRFETDESVAIGVMRNLPSTDFREIFLDEIVRLINNYLASVGTLIDHSRNLLTAHEGTEQFAEYQERICAIKQDGKAALVQKLRNYALHYAIPPIRMTLQPDAEPPQRQGRILLEVQDALQFKGWPSPARQYLLSLREDIPLAPLVSHYTDLINNLYRWLFAQYYELHKEQEIDFARLKELVPKRPSQEELTRAIAAFKLAREKEGETGK